MSSFLGKIKDIIGGGQFDDLYYEDEMNSGYQQIDNRLNPMAGEPAELVPTSTNQSGIVVSEQSSEKVESNSSSYNQNLDNNRSNNFPSNVIGMPGANNMVNEVVVMEPHSFDEVPQVIQTLKEQRSVILNLNIMDAEEAQRAVDFIAGGTYAIDGHQERIGESIFLFTPRNVKVSTVSGQSYKTTGETVVNPSSFSGSFSDSFWDDESLVHTHLAAQ